MSEAGAGVGAGAPEPEFDWVALHQDMGTAHYGEGARQKFSRKLADNPFVPIGCAATVVALTMGLWSFRQGKSEMSQMMMRCRIAAQGFTIAALVIGCLMTASKTIEKKPQC